MNEIIITIRQVALLFRNDHGKFQENKIWNISDNRLVDNARTWLYGAFFGGSTTKKDNRDTYQ